MCQVHTGAYVSLLAPGKTNYVYKYRLPPKKDYHVHITCSTYDYAYARQAQVNWKEGTKIRKEEKGKERKGKERKGKEKKGKERTGKERNGKK